MTTRACVPTLTVDEAGSIATGHNALWIKGGVKWAMLSCPLPGEVQLQEPSPVPEDWRGHVLQSQHKRSLPATGPVSPKAVLGCMEPGFGTHSPFSPSLLRTEIQVRLLAPVMVLILSPCSTSVECRSLDLVCPSKAHVSKAGSLAWRYWEMVDTLGGGAVGGCRPLGSLLSSCFHFHFLPGGGQPDLYTLPTTMCGFATGPEAAGPAVRELDPPTP